MRFIFRLVAVLVVLVVMIVVGVLMIPGEKIAGLASDQLEAQTGRKLDISGEVSTSIFPVLGVKTGALTVSNAPWSSKGPILTAKSLFIGVDLQALFSGDIKIKKIELIEPEIMLEIAANGRGNWENDVGGVSGVDGGAGGISAFSLAKAVIKNGKITFADHRSGETYVLNAVDSTLKLPAFRGRGDVSLSAQMRGQLISLTADVADFGGFLQGEVGRVNIKTMIADSKIVFAGRAGISPVAVDGNLDAELGTMAGLFKLLGMTPPELARGMGQTVAVAGNVTYTSKGSAHLRDGRITLDQNILRGAADYFPGKTPTIKAKFNADALDFTAISGGSDGGSGSSGAMGWPKDHIDVSGLSLVNGEISLAVGAVDLGVTKFGKSRISITIDRSRAVFKLLDVQAYDGTIAGQFVVNGRGGLSVGGDLKARNISMTPLLVDAADYDRLIGVGDLSFKFLGVGNSVDAIAKSLSGSGGFNLGKGELRGLDLAGMLRNLDTSYQGKGQKTIFDALGATFTIKGGVLRNDDFKFAAPLASATGKGNIGIGDQTLDCRINPVALADENGIGGISVPVIVSGTWANPQFRPDLQALINQNLAEEKAALEARLKAEEAALRAQAAAKEAELRAQAKAKEEDLRRRAEQAVGAQEGESFEEAAKRKAEKELLRGLGNLLGGN